MVDRRARDISAEALRDLLNGTISNYEYEDRYELSKIDRALGAIFTQVWFIYSDVREHKLTGKHAPCDRNRALLEQSILFLRSNLEYEWPRNEWHLGYGIMRLLGLGRILERRLSRKWSIGDEQVWPFLKRADYENAIHEQESNRT